MPANLCITPDLGKEDMDPEVSTRMIILSSKANVSESEVVNFLHMLNLPITIKWTCYGAMISGKDEYVKQAIRELRKLQRKEVLLQVTQEDAEVIDTDQGKVSTKWRRNSEFLIMLEKL